MEVSLATMGCTDNDDGEDECPHLHWHTDEIERAGRYACPRWHRLVHALQIHRLEDPESHDMQIEYISIFATVLAAIFPNILAALDGGFIVCSSPLNGDPHVVGAK